MAEKVLTRYTGKGAPTVTGNRTIRASAAITTDGEYTDEVPVAGFERLTLTIDYAKNSETTWRLYMLHSPDEGATWHWMLNVGAADSGGASAVVKAYDKFTPSDFAASDHVSVDIDVKGKQRVKFFVQAVGSGPFGLVGIGAQAGVSPVAI